MKLQIRTNTAGEVEVYLGGQRIPGLLHCAFSASVDNPAGQALLIVSPVEIMAEVDGQLIDIETTPTTMLGELEER